MLPVSTRALFAKLNPVSLKAFEAAVSTCVARTHGEITPEHLLSHLFDDPAADGARIAERLELDLDALKRALQRALEGLRAGAAGKPVFSPLLLELVQDAWMLASIELGRDDVCSGALLRALALRPYRYLAGEHEALARLSAEALATRFGELVQGSSEQGARSERPRGGGSEATTGRTGSALARFATCFTDDARAGRIDPVLGRDRELRQVIDILARRRKNNPLIVGEAGVGKTAVVEGLALRIAQGDVPDFLRDVQLYALDLGLLQAGAGVKGEFEARLKAVIDEVRAATRSTILFIDEAHTLVGAGGPAGGGDAANLLKPALARGELRTIAATTWAEYKKYFEEDAALARRFQPVKVDEPSVDVAAAMLRGIKERYERAHGVAVRDDALDAAASLSARYVSGRQLPDKAVDLLDTAAARVRIQQTSKPGAVEDLERAVAGIERQLAALERDRAAGVPVPDEQLASLRAQRASRDEERAAVTAHWHAQRALAERVRALRDEGASEPGAAGDPRGANAKKAALELARAEHAAECAAHGALVRLEVEPAVVAQVVGDWTGVPVGHLVSDDARRVLALEPSLRARIKGQDHALDAVGEALRAARAGLRDPRKPQVFLLAGPSGVGKTELGLAVADALFGGERFVVSLNMSEYQDREMGVSGLLGARPGYVGYGKGGTLTEAVRQRPYAVVLLDEIEKAAVEVRNLFYQVFDKGDLTDGTGRAIDFKNTVLFLTTNLGADQIAAACAGDARPSPEELTERVRPSLVRALSSAWVARTTVLPFYPLDAPALRSIAGLKLARLAQTFYDSQRARLTFDDAVSAALVARCHEADTGARNIDLVLQSALVPALSRAALDALTQGERVPDLHVSLDPAGAFRVEPVLVEVPAALAAPPPAAPALVAQPPALEVQPPAAPTAAQEATAEPAKHTGATRGAKRASAKRTGATKAKATEASAKAPRAAKERVARKGPRTRG